MAETIIKFANQVLKLCPQTEADISVMREIFKAREYRVAEEIIRSATEPIVDVGAHVGFFSLYARAFNSKVKIFAIEPEPQNLILMEKHFQNNSVKNIKIITGALAGESGQRNLVVAEDSHNHYLLGGNNFEAKKKISVETFSLADFCAKNKIKKISLLKMDIEGGEFEVIKSLSPADFLLFRNVILEYHNGNGRDYRALELILREHGFGVQIFPSKFDKTMGFIFARNKRA